MKKINGYGLFFVLLVSLLLCLSVLCGFTSEKMEHEKNDDYVLKNVEKEEFDIDYVNDDPGLVYFPELDAETERCPIKSMEDTVSFPARYIFIVIIFLMVIIFLNLVILGSALIFLISSKINR